ncbi:MAG: isoprenylcysteine carboxylmethyltransferase family protein [Bacteriovoracaceae bacterium]|nr:isoprenylcysteine carboxylmethyltransferase family protein [Bacteroidota bacterium]
MYSKLLVILQFTLIAAIVQYCSFPFYNPYLLPLGLLSGVIGFLAILTMKWDNLRVQPIPKQDAELITSGIYKFIRHPMYLSVLLLMLPFVITTLDRLSLSLYFLLFATLIKKLQFEERLLLQKFPSYSDYMKQTYRLIPFIF